jgi:hypothetical protein
MSRCLCLISFSAVPYKKTQRITQWMDILWPLRDLRTWWITARENQIIWRLFLIMQGSHLRNEIFPEYKAHRDRCPEALQPATITYKNYVCHAHPNHRSERVRRGRRPDRDDANRPKKRKLQSLVTPDKILRNWFLKIFSVYVCPNGK